MIKSLSSLNVFQFCRIQDDCMSNGFSCRLGHNYFDIPSVGRSIEFNMSVDYEKWVYICKYSNSSSSNASLSKPDSLYVDSRIPLSRKIGVGCRQDAAHSNRKDGSQNEYGC